MFLYLNVIPPALKLKSSSSRRGEDQNQLPNWTTDSADTFRHNLLMGCRQHQAILMTQQRPSHGQSSGKDCGSLVPLSENSSPTRRLALSQAGACGSFLCWEDPSFSKEGLPFSVHTGNWRRVIPVHKQNRETSLRGFSPWPSLKALLG